MSKFKFKAMIAFFDIRGIVHIEWVPVGQTVKQVYCKDTTLRERARRRRLEMWKNSLWILYQDNALGHKAMSTQQFSAIKMPVLEHPPYSPDIAPCDVFLFPKIVWAKRNQIRVR